VPEIDGVKYMIANLNMLGKSQPQIRPDSTGHPDKCYSKFYQNS